MGSQNRSPGLYSFEIQSAAPCSISLQRPVIPAYRAADNQFSAALFLPEDPMLHLDTGNTGFMILCTSLVMLMTPGLAFFYGGLVGRKNVLSIMIQRFVSMGWTTVILSFFCYSLWFSGDVGGIIGNLDMSFLKGVDLMAPSPVNPTIPLIVFVAYQMMFAIITPARSEE